MDKLKYVRVQQLDGSFSGNIPVAADAKNVTFRNENDLQSTVGDIDVETDGNIATNLNRLKQLVQQLDSKKANRLDIGNPLVVHEAANMTDTNKIYIYIGQQAGYINGNWYYWDGSSWVSGGIYNAARIQTDDSLSIVGAPADAAAVGIELENLRDSLQNVSIDVDDLGLYQDIDTGYVYPTYKGMTSENGIPLASTGGGGGGGGDINNAALTATNTSGWLSKTISHGSSCPISFTWSSIEDQIPTGNGTARITVNSVIKSLIQIQQGQVNIDLKPFLVSGNNVIKIRIADIYDNGQTITFNVSSVEFTISSNFDTNMPFEGGDITFPYTPYGSISKTIYFFIDNIQIGTIITAASNRQLTYNIPPQSHGSHTLKCYFEAEVNGQNVRSNELYYEFMFIEEGNNTPIITTSYTNTKIQQYDSIIIPYRVYTPNSQQSNVYIFINDNNITGENPMKVGRSQTTFTYRAEEAGTLNIKIKSKNTEKIFVITVEQSTIITNAETENLALFLNAKSRSNSEISKNVWGYNDISATMTDFTWKLDGWQVDSDGIGVLRLLGDARVTIPYQLFGLDVKKDFKVTGKTIQIEFSTHDVSDYTTTILSCFANNIGLKITPQNVTFRGAQTEINTLYKENEHIRLSFVVEKQNENRLILIYINGIMSRAVQYASGERFSQLNPVNITIGSNDCGIDIYNIRVYDNDLNRQQILNNWIADTQINTLRIDRYTHNHVYNDAGEIPINNLPKDLPYMILNGNELPQYKGDKKVITGSYTDPTSSAKSFTFTGCQIDVQGTSSSVYFRKNYDLKFKNGFITNNGTTSTYALRTGSIPFNRFVIKADVASSESANNTKLTMFYNDTCPYKTPEMLANPKVRWGIEGIPIVVYYHNTLTDTTEFLGKYNFNLPKRAPGPYGYGDSDTLESWEWERNNSDNVKFKDNDFTKQSYDAKEDKWYPEWYNDFEARFPSDEWRDISKLNELISWVKSTWREAATNEVFENPITYTLSTNTTITRYLGDDSFTVVEQKQGGATTGYSITFTKDTPAYRLTKFRAEFDNYFQRESAIFYYLFTELFLMIDSRAKNMFIGFNGDNISNNTNRFMDRKATIQPYDMDTAVGTNNSGVLMFGYYHEDTDTVSSIISGGTDGGSQAQVFNAQDSVLWVNLRDAFRSQINNMYMSLRTKAQNGWSYQIVENLYEQHQAKWCEAIFNEDAYIKYIYPLVEAVTVDEETGNLIKTDRYLTMLQGSKTEQRKWWLYNRFRYMDSKFNVGNATNNTLDIRLFNSGTFTINPAIDMYVAIAFGLGSVPEMKRTTTNNPVTFSYIQPSNVQQMETSIFSGDLITDLGDLSVFYPNEINFAKGTRLKRLKIGSSESGYSNTHLRLINVTNSPLLEYINCQNCPNLAVAINLENSPMLAEAYFDNSGITGADFADGGALQVLHLPGTITSLTLFNLNKLIDFQCPSFSNVSRVMLTNIDSNIVDPVEILNTISPNSQVNIQGLNLKMENSTEIEEFLNLLDTMQGIVRDRATSDQTGMTDEQKKWDQESKWNYYAQEKAVVQGTIHTDTLTGTQIAAYKARYPYIDFIATNVVSTVTYKTYDGSSIVSTEQVIKNSQTPHPNATYSGKPGRTSSAQYNYTFAGWSTTPNGAAQDDAQEDIQGDRILYAAYTATVRTYTVTWQNSNGTTLETDNNVPYGATPTYDGTTPVDPSGSSSPFVAWTPAISSVTGSITYTASYKPIWTVTFKSQDGNTTLQTKSVIDGDSVSYTGTTPTNTDQTAFLGWSNSINSSTTDAVLTNINANKTFYAAHEVAVEVAEITDTWDQIIQHIDAGDYSTRYKIGNYKPLDLGTEGIINMQIVAMDADELASGGMAPLTFLGMELLATNKRMNPAQSGSSGSYNEGTGTIGGWEHCEMRTYLKNTIKPLVPSTVRSRINNVIKYSRIYNTAGTTVNNVTSTEDVWIPSSHEMGRTSTAETMGPIYNGIFTDDASRVKKKVGESSASFWWSRSAGNGNNFRGVDTDGSITSGGASSPSPLTIGFCLGLESETIEDDWATILANQNYATDYAIGDTKMLDLGTEGKHLMEIVAFDEDDRADGNGKAGITWISKTLLNSAHRMNPERNNNIIGTGGNGGWENCEMRTYLKNTIKPLIPATVRNAIVPVTKIQTTVTNGSAVINGQTTTDDVWIPSVREIFNDSSSETIGAVYNAKFIDAESKKKKYLGSPDPQNYWWLRTAKVAYGFCTISSGKEYYNSKSTNNYYIALGFCTN